MSAALPSYDEAASLVGVRAARLARHPTVERVDLVQALGRVLAEPIRADRDQPPFPRSTRDGYACRATEASEHRELTVAGSTRAGQGPGRPIVPGEAWEIMTGAPCPEGADAVVMLEHVDRTGDTIRVRPPRKLEPGENIVPQGAEARTGDEILSAGAHVNAAVTALAASCGYADITVFHRPRVAILTTGDELVPVAATPGPGQIRNSNAAMLAALVTECGGDPWVLPTARDNEEALAASLEQVPGTDMLLISGGVSAGKFDLVEPALGRLGARFHFTGVRIQPGKPLVFGELPLVARPGERRFAGRDTLPFFGLPGNPISSAATFLLFGAQILAALAGSLPVGPRFVLARLARPIKGRTDLTRFVPSFCKFKHAAGEPPEVGPTPSQGSGDLVSFSRSNCFMVVPEGAERLSAGEFVRILPFSF
jgi:molybdopterin molybdotransferase